MSYEQNRGGQENSFENIQGDASTAFRDAAQNVQQQAKQSFDSQRETLARQAQAFEHAIQAAAADLREHDNYGLSHYVAEIADGVGSFAQNLQQKSVDELIQDISSIARRNPTLFIAGSIAIGLGISRFAKASSQRGLTQSDKHYSEEWSESDRWNQPGAYWSESDQREDEAYSSVSREPSYEQSSSRIDRIFPTNSFEDRYPAGAFGYTSTASEADYAADDFTGAENLDADASYSAGDYSVGELSFDDDLEEFQRAQNRESTSAYNRSLNTKNLSNGGKRYE